MNRESQDAKIMAVREKLQQFEKLVVLTGAGISAESGVPTFRGKDGLWRHYRAIDLATPEAFRNDPKLVWEFYNWRRELLSPLRPNAAHLALVNLENQVPDFVLITQNIDNLHQQAGNRNILELHGNIWRVRCTKCHRVTENHTVPLSQPPLCEACGFMLRPDVVWFGESLDQSILERAIDAIEKCQMMFIIGTSAVVQPAASMGLHAKKRGAFVVEINLEATPYTGMYDLSIFGNSGDIVPALC